MCLHPTCAVIPDREPPGMLDAWMWARQPRGADGQCRGNKESVRWIDGYERVADILHLPGRGLGARAFCTSLRNTKRVKCSHDSLR